MNVPAEAWLEAVRNAVADGYRYFDWLGGVDDIGHSDTFHLVLVLRDLDRPAAEPLTVTTDVPRDEPRLDSIGGIFVGARWHEREAAELFGVEFTGGDQRRLLLDPGYAGTPLRKDEVLGARAAAAWPGAKEPGETDASPSRRRMVPPGLPDPEVWGDRAADRDPAAPTDVAESAVGGRVRRRGR
ncbi:MAG: NADH-quinone oxidoreductase subunit C [Propionibacteriaceae bacterium]